MDELLKGELDVFAWRGWLVDGGVRERERRKGEAVDLTFPASLGSRWLS